MKNLWQLEQECFQEGHSLVAGVDEVGMGCLAGPVVACALILDPKNIPQGIKDSKLLTPKKRSQLDIEIRAVAIAFAIGMASVEEIDTVNIYQAARLAMKRAVSALAIQPTFLLIDGRAKIDLPLAQKSIIKGDSLSLSIGAASIVAKVYRDSMMEEFDQSYPGYSFAKHKGYGSVLHRLCLQKNGPTPIHRKSFSWTPVGEEGGTVVET